MTRDEFMKVARVDAGRILESKENGIMNLVERAWAEGKRNAEVDTLKAALEEALDKRDKICTINNERHERIGRIFEALDDEAIALMALNNVLCEYCILNDTCDKNHCRSTIRSFLKEGKYD